MLFAKFSHRHRGFRPSVRPTQNSIRGTVLRQRSSLHSEARGDAGTAARGFKVLARYEPTRMVWDQQGSSQPILHQSPQRLGQEFLGEKQNKQQQLQLQQQQQQQQQNFPRRSIAKYD